MKRARGKRGSGGRKGERGQGVRREEGQKGAGGHEGGGREGAGGHQDLGTAPCSTLYAKLWALDLGKGCNIRKSISNDARWKFVKGAGIVGGGEMALCDTRRTVSITTTQFHFALIEFRPSFKKSCCRPLTIQGTLFSKLQHGLLRAAMIQLS